jgi:hypothetical protein
MQPGGPARGTAFRPGPSTARPVGNRARAGTARGHRPCLGRLSSPRAGMARHGLFNEARRRPEPASGLPPPAPRPAPPPGHIYSMRTGDGCPNPNPHPTRSRRSLSLAIPHSAVSTHLGTSPRPRSGAPSPEPTPSTSTPVTSIGPQPPLDAHDWLCCSAGRRHGGTFPSSSTTPVAARHLPELPLCSLPLHPPSPALLPISPTI